MSVVLENHYDPSYEPSNSEIEEYGKWLGMEFPKHQALLWIAREGLKAALPDSWKACKSEKGELYYFNFRSGQSMWDHPMDSHFKGLFQTELAKLEQGGSQPADAVVADLPEKQMTVKRKSQAKKDDAVAAADMSATAEASTAGGANGKKREKAITFVSPPKTVEHLQPSPAQDALMSESALLPMAAATTSSTTATSAKGGPTDAAASAESAVDGSRKPMSGMSKLAALKSLKGGPSSSAATTPTNATVTAAAAQRKPSPVPTSVKVEAASTLNTTAPLAAIPSATTAALAPVKDPRSRSPPDIEVTAAPAPAIQIPADAVSSSRSASPVTTASTTTPKSPAGVTAGVLTAAQKAELEKGARAHAAATAAMKRAQAEELARIEEAHAARKAELKAQHAAEVASLDAKIREAQSRNIADLAARKQQLAADLEREFAEIQQKLRAAQAVRIERLNVEEQEDKSVSATTASMSVQQATSVQGAIMAAMASVPALLAECAATLSRAEADFESTLRSELIEQRVQRVQRDVEAAAADAHRGDMLRVDAEWKSKLAQVQSSCADQLQTLTSAHANKVSELARTTTYLTLSVERIRGERDTALAAARSANQEALRREATLHEDALHAAQTQYSQAVAKARLENEQRLQSVRQELLAEYLAAEAELRRKAKVEYDALVAGIGSFRSTTAAESGTSNSTGRGSAIAPPGIPAVRVEVPDVDSSQSTNRAESDTSTPSHQHDRRASSSGKPASMSADALAVAAAAADAYMHGPLSISSNETSPAARQRTLAENELQSGGGGRPATPMTAALHPVDGKLSGDALRAAVVNVIRELVVESGFVARATESGSISAPPSMLEQTARTRETGTVMSPQHSVTNVAGNATPPQRAVHPVDSDDNDISPIKSHNGGTGNGYGSSQNLLGLVVGSSSHGHRQPVPPAFPHSLQEQKRLIQRERQRLDNAKSFLDRQQDGNDRQRAALKAARSKWKKDVRAAKAAGTSSSSRKAEVLRNVHALLDQQADMLAHDEAVLQESKLWLQTKEDRLTRLEDQLLRPINMNDSAATNGTAAETTAMLAAFLELEPPLPAHPPPPTAVASMSGSGTQKPHAHQQSPRRRSGSMRVSHTDPHDVPPLSSLLPRDVNREAGPHSSRKPSPTSVLAAPRQRSESRPATPQAVVADALLRIETRLAEVTSLVKSTTTTTSDRERRHKHGGASQSATNSRSASASKEMALLASSSRRSSSKSTLPPSVAFALDTY
jgi:hypothetical protein